MIVDGITLVAVVMYMKVVEKMAARRRQHPTKDDICFERADIVMFDGKVGRCAVFFIPKRI